MWWVAIVKTRVSCFCAVEIAVESRYFNADFGDQIAGEMGGECRRVVLARMWEEVRVEQVCYGLLAAHLAWLVGFTSR